MKSAKGMSAEGENSRSEVDGAARQPGPQGLPKTNPTPEELALAESIADKHAYRDECFWDLLQEAALSAIQQTTELAAKLVENPDRSGREWVRDSLWGNISADLSTALRRNDHLGDV